VVGFTPLSEWRDPEAVLELLSAYFEVARTVIGRYGGVVEKFIGDAVMAVWGTTSGELLALLDRYRPGQLAPVERAERDLARARLGASGDGLAAASSFSAAVSKLRELSTHYHLAHGLLDYAGHLTGMHDDTAAAAAVSEARTIAQQLRCQPLLDRVADVAPAESRARA